jgi:hypothetical protein
VGKRLIAAICRIDPDNRRLYAARLLIGSIVGWLASHVLLVLLGESSFFNHTVMLISWWAITLTCVDVIVTSDVRAEQDEQGTTG